MSELKRFKELSTRFQKAEKFYASDAPDAQKEKFRDKLDALVDELATLYTKLSAEGKAPDLPEATYEQGKMMFRGVEIEYSEELGKWVEV